MLHCNLFLEAEIPNQESISLLLIICIISIKFLCPLFPHIPNIHILIICSSIFFLCRFISIISICCCLIIWNSYFIILFSSIFITKNLISLFNLSKLLLSRRIMIRMIYFSKSKIRLFNRVLRSSILKF